MTETHTRKVIVIGAGIIGLTTAIAIQEKGGYKVTIVAELVPSDPKGTRYASHWAGALHVSRNIDDRQKRMDMDTFQTMWKMSAPGSPSEHCFLRMTQEEYHHEEVNQPKLRGLMPDYEEHPQQVWPAGTVHGTSFTTVTVDTPVYLKYMMDRFIDNGGSVVRGTVQHIDQLVEGGEYTINQEGGVPVPPDAIVVCTGLGARTLGGVEDEDVFPIRGQTVLLRAPWVKFGRTLSSPNGTSWTYVIPRKSGNIVVGGIMVANDWYPQPRPEITHDILERVFDMCPELVSPEIRAVRKPTIDDLLPNVIEEGCGFRPARKGGIRIEGEQRGSVSVVYNYGHGGYGYISSWGSAARALAVLESLLQKMGIESSH